MTSINPREILRDNWHLIGVFLLLLILIVLVPFYTNAKGSPELLPRQEMQIVHVRTDSENNSVTSFMNREPRKTVEEQIESYQNMIRENPHSPDVPSWLTASGNLCFQRLSDYEKAAQYYEEVLQNYPGWDNLRHVYIQLATCYERLEDWERARRVYKRMMEYFPEDSQEYVYAKAKYEGALP